MSLRFIEGFDHYNSILQKWTTAAVAPAFTSSGTRFGVGQCLSIGNNNISKGMDNQATWIVGAAVYESTLVTATVISLLDSSAPQMEVRATNLGALQVVRGGNTQLGITANGILSPAVWYYLEFKATINNSTGSYEVRVNGVNVLSATGVDTQDTANAYANQIMFSGTTQYSYDDIYMCDGTGSTNNDFLGDVRVDTIFPTADGSSTDFTPSTGTDNYAMVDDATPDSDSTYVSSSTLNDIDLYTYGDLQSLTGAVYGVQSLIFARKDDAGARSVAPVIKTGATTAVGSDFALGASYTYGRQIFETNPANGSTAWTISDVNNSEFGIKVTA
jgi:hypothetical protein